MIQHVTLECRHEDEADLVRFWSVLGFQQVSPPAGLGERAIWVQRAGTQVHLLFAEHPVAPGQGHVAIVADDYEATVRDLRRAGFAPEARTPHWGAARSFVRGPGGHLVEVMAAPPPG